MIKYRVEMFDDEVNDFIKISSHGNIEYAEANAEAKHEARNKDVRIIYKGKIIKFYPKEVKNENKNMG